MSIECLLDLTQSTPAPEALYVKLTFPEPPEDRPYVYINMAATVDGKIVVGQPEGTAKGVGGPTDQLLFRRLQKHCDAALLGATTLRASNVLYPPEIARFVVTRSGKVPLENRFFADAPDKAGIIAPKNLPPETRSRLQTAALVVQAGDEDVDLTEALHFLRHTHGIRTLLCEGGGALNEQLIRAGLVDELFLTLAPKLKGGVNLPTIMAGPGFPPGSTAPLTILSVYRDASELYLRYRLGSPSGGRQAK